MVYDGVHNPAVRLSYPGADSHCCADPYACTCGSAYPRADTDTNSHATSGVNSYTDSHAGTNSHANPEWRLMVSDR